MAAPADSISFFMPCLVRTEVIYYDNIVLLKVWNEMFSKVCFEFFSVQRTWKGGVYRFAANSNSSSVVVEFGVFNGTESCILIPTMVRP